MKRIAYFLLIAVVLVGCKSSKRLTATKVPEVAASEAAIPSYLASRLQLTIPGKGGSMSVGGTMKMKSTDFLADAYSPYGIGTHRGDSY